MIQTVLAWNMEERRKVNSPLLKYSSDRQVKVKLQLWVQDVSESWADPSTYDEKWTLTLSLPTVDLLTANATYSITVAHNEMKMMLMHSRTQSHAHTHPLTHTYRECNHFYSLCIYAHTNTWLQLKQTGSLLCPITDTGELQKSNITGLLMIVSLLVSLLIDRRLEFTTINSQ